MVNPKNYCTRNIFKSLKSSLVGTLLIVIGCLIAYKQQGTMTAEIVAVITLFIAKGIEQLFVKDKDKN